MDGRCDGYGNYLPALVAIYRRLLIDVVKAGKYMGAYSICCRCRLWGVDRNCKRAGLTTEGSLLHPTPKRAFLSRQYSTSRILLSFILSVSRLFLIVPLLLLTAITTVEETIHLGHPLFTQSWLSRLISPGSKPASMAPKPSSPWSRLASRLHT